MFINDLIGLDLPKVQEKKSNFFDISKFPSREQVISNWYAYYLNSDEMHGLGALFLNALVKLGSEKEKKQLQLLQYSVRTEVSTKSQKRIDILISGRGISYGMHVTIENKIKHVLDNDLEDYWTYIETEEASKIGIVLSILPVKIPEKQQNKFVNILHRDWFAEVEKNIPNKWIDATQEFYYKEFKSAIDNLTKDVTMNENVKIYLEHAALINNAVNTKKAAVDYVFNQIRIACENLGLQFRGENEKYSWCFRKGEDRIHYTIITNNLWEYKKIGIVIELKPALFSKISEFDRDLINAINEAGLNHKSSPHNQYYLHYVSKYYDLDFSHLEKLSDFIENEVKGRFQQIFDKILLLSEN